MQALNDTQRKLVEDNHNLIYSFLKSKRLSLDAVEDWYGTAAIGLCKAALHYDESKGHKFSTFAYLVMDNEVKQIMRKDRKSVKASYSLDSPTSAENCFLSDVIPDNRDFMTSIYLHDAMDIASRGMSDRDKLIVKLILQGGYSQKDVSTQLGLSQPQVSRIYHTYINKIKDYFND